MSNAEVELVALHDHIGVVLAGLKHSFEDGMRLTLVARHPGFLTRYLLVSDDPLQRRMQAFVAAGCPELHPYSAPSQSKGANYLTEVDYPLEGL